VEGPQSGRAREGPFRENCQSLALLRRLGQPLGVGQALLQVEALNEQAAEALQQDARPEAAAQLALGDEAPARRGQRRDQQQAVEV